MPLFTRRTLLWPTRLGWLVLIAVPATLLGLWWFLAEGFLSRSHRVAADVLIVESWVGRDGMHAAKEEFERGSYRYLVVTGSPLPSGGWSRQPFDHAAYMRDQLISLGMAEAAVIRARTPHTNSQRTFSSASAARVALQEAKVEPTGINVITIGAHARRSRVVFARAFSKRIPVGVISHRPSNYPSGPWWRSSERADDVLKETIGYPYELLFWSGRWSGSPADSAAATP